ncbi:uncharacterized protein LY89DRAFT_435854 [Mollisia scopiformis]|uniref:Uncharacterized protein n=1 Tax=Mollisia scopiformis TaxID=149040 RepID=A0A194XMX8_MOLSC|nr:uncharacterized protein LY89DRAFT_435854 [Mollisia scopiformis]KUJ21481.1 hypothetical protein LY89DRAFT_435854 [Mollisia scopiformis]
MIVIMLPMLLILLLQVYEELRHRSILHPNIKSSDTPPSKREKSRRRSPEHPQDPYINIVEPPSPGLPPKKPSLKTYSSEPPMVSSRKEPSRSKTQDYPRQDPNPPPLPRAQTFNGDTRERGRDHGSSRLRKEYASAESDSDAPGYPSPRLSHSPRRTVPEPTVYRVQDSRAHPVPSRSHRSDLHGLNEPSYARERSTSPRGTPHRPPMSRNPPSGEYRTSPSAYYSVPEAPPTKPHIVTARPKMPREGSGRSHSHRAAPNASYEQVKYAPTYDQSQVKFADYAAASLYDSNPGQVGRLYAGASFVWFVFWIRCCILHTLTLLHSLWMGREPLSRRLA